MVCAFKSIWRSECRTLIPILVQPATSDWQTTYRMQSLQTKMTWRSRTSWITLHMTSNAISYTPRRRKKRKEWNTRWLWLVQYRDIEGDREDRAMCCWPRPRYGDGTNMTWFELGWGWYGWIRNRTTYLGLKGKLVQHRRYTIYYPLLLELDGYPLRKTVHF